MPGGGRCGAPPGRDSALCFWHDPGKADDLAEAQRLGGMRRKRERTIAAAYDFAGLDGIAAIRRILVIATTDAFSLENSIPRVSRPHLGCARLGEAARDRRVRGAAYGT